MNTDVWTQMYPDVFNRPISQECIMTPREFRTERQKALHRTSVREGNLGVIYENPDRQGHP
eukprot:582623-Karenia_brevis.AAC.1